VGGEGTTRTDLTATYGPGSLSCVVNDIMDDVNPNWQARGTCFFSLRSRIHQQQPCEDRMEVGIGAVERWAER
jgi:hypothetical protein